MTCLQILSKYPDCSILLVVLGNNNSNNAQLRIDLCFRENFGLGQGIVESTDSSSMSRTVRSQTVMKCSGYVYETHIK